MGVLGVTVPSTALASAASAGLLASVSDTVASASAPVVPASNVVAAVPSTVAPVSDAAGQTATVSSIRTVRTGRRSNTQA